MQIEVDGQSTFDSESKCDGSAVVSGISSGLYTAANTELYALGIISGILEILKDESGNNDSNVIIGIYAGVSFIFLPLAIRTFGRYYQPTKDYLDSFCRSGVEATNYVNLESADPSRTQKFYDSLFIPAAALKTLGVSASLVSFARSIHNSWYGVGIGLVTAALLLPTNALGQAASLARPSADTERMGDTFLWIKRDSSLFKPKFVAGVFSLSNTVLSVSAVMKLIGSTSWSPWVQIPLKVVTALFGTALFKPYYLEGLKLTQMFSGLKPSEQDSATDVEAAGNALLVVDQKSDNTPATASHKQAVFAGGFKTVVAQNASTFLPIFSLVDNPRTLLILAVIVIIASFVGGLTQVAFFSGETTKGFASNPARRSGPIGSLPQPSVALESAANAKVSASAAAVPLLPAFTHS